MNSGSSARPSPRQAPRPAPLERGRAVGLLVGLTCFSAGFALAGVLALLGAGGGPGYLVGITVGLVGMGVVGLFLHRGTVPIPPEARVWSPTLLRMVLTPLGLPVMPVTVALYLLATVGLVGNLVVPLALRR